MLSGNDSSISKISFPELPSPNAPSLVTEDESYSNRFQKLGGGLNVNLGRWQFETGVDFRTDELYKGTGSWENESYDFIGYVNYRSFSEKGWKQNIVYKKRIK